MRREPNALNRQDRAKRGTEDEGKSIGADSKTGVPHFREKSLRLRPLNGLDSGAN